MFSQLHVIHISVVILWVTTYLNSAPTSQLHAAEPPRGLKKMSISKEFRPANGSKPSPSFSWHDSTASIDSHKYPDGKVRRAISIGYMGVGGVVYPIPSNGEILPLFGNLYCKKLGEYEWIEDDEIPKGTSVRPDSLIVPLSRDGVGLARVKYDVNRSLDPLRRETSNATIVVESIKTFRKSVGKPPQAMLRLPYFKKSATQKLSTKRITVRTGDTLQFGIEKWTVRRIVPRDAQRQILGWVELAPPRRKQRPAVIVQNGKTLTLKATGKPADQQVVDPHDRLAWISDTFQGKDGKLWMSGVWTNAQPIYSKSKLNFPPVTTGDVVPLWGKVYRVASVNNDSISFKELEDGILPAKDLPGPGSTLLPYCSPRGGYAESFYPFRSRGCSSDNKFTDVIIRDKTISDGGTGKTRYAFLTLFRPFFVRTVRTGYPIDKMGISLGRSQTRNVVLPDEKKQIIGWLEIAPLRE